MSSLMNRFDRCGRMTAAARAFSVRATEYSVLSVFPGRP